MKLTFNYRKSPKLFLSIGKAKLKKQKTHAGCDIVTPSDCDMPKNQWNVRMMNDRRYYLVINDHNSVNRRFGRGLESCLRLFKITKMTSALPDKNQGFQEPITFCAKQTRFVHLERHVQVDQTQVRLTGACLRLKLAEETNFGNQQCFLLSSLLA